MADERGGENYAQGVLRLTNDVKNQEGRSRNQTSQSWRGAERGGVRCFPVGEEETGWGDEILCDVIGGSRQSVNKGDFLIGGFQKKAGADYVELFNGNQQ